MSRVCDFKLPITLIRSIHDGEGMPLCLISNNYANTLWSQQEDNALETIVLVYGSPLFTTSSYHDIYMRFLLMLCMAKVSKQK